MKEQRKLVSIISLGCSKNLVDSERLARLFDSAGISVKFTEDKPAEGSFAVVNTCGFIGDAKEESINTILELINLKKEGYIRGVYAMGCLTERYREELTTELPELDGIYGKFDWKAIVGEIEKLHADNTVRPWERILSGAPHYTYIKISEGCNRFCAFCAIPLITGRHHSRPADEILAEVSDLVSKGTVEFNIIAQDLSSYGRDLDEGENALASLLDSMANIEGVEMIRLHYAYPSDFPYSILPVMARHDNICKYLDIALQHISDKVLENMRRHITGKETRELLERIRREVPGIHIRTTLMVGFPGEDEQAFEELMQFVSEQKFERMGAFAYCEEDGTFAARHLDDNIPEDVKQERLDKLMALQHEIGCEVAQAKVGTTQRVIIDEYDASLDAYVGRTQYDSPEVDCVVYVRSEKELQPGSIHSVTIDSVEDFDLWGSL